MLKQRQCAEREEEVCHLFESRSDLLDRTVSFSATHFFLRAHNIISWNTGFAISSPSLLLFDPPYRAASSPAPTQNSTHESGSACGFAQPSTEGATAWSRDDCTSNPNSSHPACTNDISMAKLGLCFFRRSGIPITRGSAKAAAALKEEGEQCIRRGVVVLETADARNAQNASGMDPTPGRFSGNQTSRRGRLGRRVRSHHHQTASTDLRRQRLGRSVLSNGESGSESGSRGQGRQSTTTSVVTEAA